VTSRLRGYCAAPAINADNNEQESKMTDETTTETQVKSEPAPAKKKTERRTYTVLHLVQPAEPENNVPATWIEIGQYKASDEKEARWAAVDANEELAAQTRDEDGTMIPANDAPLLVAVSERNWTPKLTAEVVVTKATRA
jgi:hypothetical protein